MTINTNLWNRIRYTLYTPIYDLIGRIFRDSRRKSIESLRAEAGDKVLIIGAGTGLDLEFLPAGCKITATDITPSMVGRVKARGRELNLNVGTMVMDGQALSFADSSFDRVILHLILAVIPDPIACIREAERVLRPGGRIAVFDKFVRKGRRVTAVRRMFNLLTTFFFSDITRDLESIVSSTELTVISDTDADLNGNFRLITLCKE